MSRRLDLTDLPCDRTTARRVMMLAHERCEPGLGDIRAAMAEVVREAVEAWCERRRTNSRDGTAPGTQTVKEQATASPDEGEWMWRDRGATR